MLPQSGGAERMLLQLSQRSILLRLIAASLVAGSGAQLAADAEESPLPAIMAAETAQEPEIPFPSLALWLRADRGITRNAMVGVIRWADQGPAHRDALPPAGKPPRLLQNAHSGLPAVLFESGQSQYFNLTTPIVAPQYTVFFVGRSRTRNVNASATVLGPRSGTPDSWIRWQAAASLRVAFAGPANYVQLFWGNTRTVHISTIVKNSRETRLYRDGVYRGGTGSNPLMSNFGQIGARYSVIPLQGELEELIIYANGLTESALAPIHQYLKAKYGL